MSDRIRLKLKTPSGAVCKNIFTGEVRRSSELAILIEVRESSIRRLIFVGISYGNWKEIKMFCNNVPTWYVWACDCRETRRCTFVRRIPRLRGGEPLSSTGGYQMFYFEYENVFDFSRLYLFYKEHLFWFFSPWENNKNIQTDIQTPLKKRIFKNSILIKK